MYATLLSLLRNIVAGTQFFRLKVILVYHRWLLFLILVLTRVSLRLTCSESPYFLLCSTGMSHRLVTSLRYKRCKNSMHYGSSYLGLNVISAHGIPASSNFLLHSTSEQINSVLHSRTLLSTKTNFRPEYRRSLASNREMAEPEP